MWLIIVLLILIIICKAFQPQIFGRLVEAVVNYRLSKLDPEEYFIINNFMAVVDGRSTEIDHIVVSRFGIFVIETKNYKGIITGHEKSKDWKQTIYKVKNNFYSPIRQNYSHLMALKAILKDYPEIPFVPIVAFTGDVILNVQAPNSIVIHCRDLNYVIEQYTKSILSEKVKNLIYYKLMLVNSNDKKLRKDHIASIRRKNKIVKYAIQSVQVYLASRNYMVRQLKNTWAGRLPWFGYGRDSFLFPPSISGPWFGICPEIG